MRDRSGWGSSGTTDLHSGVNHYFHTQYGSHTTPFFFNSRQRMMNREAISSKDESIHLYPL